MGNEAEKAKLKVLVVDDQTDLLGVLKEILINENYEVSTCPTGELALELIKKRQFNMLITDIGLPGIDGWQLVIESKQYQADMPVIMISSWKDDETELLKEKHGVLTVIHKPFRVTELIDAIDTFVISKIPPRACGKIS